MSGNEEGKAAPKPRRLFPGLLMATKTERQVDVGMDAPKLHAQAPSGSCWRRLIQTHDLGQRVRFRVSVGIDRRLVQLATQGPRSLNTRAGAEDKRRSQRGECVGKKQMSAWSDKKKRNERRPLPRYDNV